MPALIQKFTRVPPSLQRLNKEMSLKQLNAFSLIPLVRFIQFVSSMLLFILSQAASYNIIYNKRVKLNTDGPKLKIIVLALIATAS